MDYYFCKTETHNYTHLTKANQVYSPLCGDAAPDERIIYSGNATDTAIENKNNLCFDCFMAYRLLKRRANLSDEKF